MMKNPNVIYMSERWLVSLSENTTSANGKSWYPARPLGYSGILNRIHAAWLVFTGKADALRWMGGQ